MDYLLSLYLESRNIRILVNIYVLVSIVTAILLNLVSKYIGIDQKREAAKKSRVKLDDKEKEKVLENKTLMFIGTIIGTIFFSTIPILNAYYMYKSINNLMIIVSNKRIEKNDL